MKAFVSKPIFTLLLVTYQSNWWQKQVCIIALYIYIFSILVYQSFAKHKICLIIIYIHTRVESRHFIEGYIGPDQQVTKAAEKNLYLCVNHTANQGFLNLQNDLLYVPFGTHLACDPWGLIKSDCDMPYFRQANDKNSKHVLCILIKRVDILLIIT